MKVDIHYLFVAKYAKWIIVSLVTLLSLMILMVWGSVFFSSPSKVLPKVAESREASIQPSSYHEITQASLFGVFVPNDLANVKKSMLNVTLVGILFADPIEDSQVIIQDSSGEALNYKLGDKIPGDASIKRITSMGVLVERNGALESLSLPKNDLTFEPVTEDPLKEE